MKNGVRESSATSYLKPALGRKNLKLLTDTLAISLEFSEDRSATGIRLRRKGKSFQLRANRGVILWRRRS